MDAKAPKRFDVDDPRIEELENLLEQRAVPFGGMGLETLDGFLTALVLSHDTVPPSEWTPRVWGKTPPRWETLEETAHVYNLLMSAWNSAAHRVRLGNESDSPLALPYWWLPDDPEAEQADDVDIGAAWAGGFLDGMEMRSDDWDACIAKDEWIGEIEAHIELLAVGSHPPAEGETEPVIVSYRERLEIFFSLPDMLLDLHCHRIDALTPREPVRRAATPERNEACPCGSGRKYKKCCGAN